MEKFSTNELVKTCINSVQKKLWITQLKAHPQYILDRKYPALGTQVIDQVNDYHAYCIPCHYHIYSCTNPRDEASYFINHINTQEHWVNVSCQKLPKTSSILEPVFEDLPDDDITDFWECNACKVLLEPEMKTGTSALELEILNHEQTSGHEYNSHLMSDPVQSVLVAIASTPLLMKLSSNIESNCQICSTMSPEIGLDNHVKSANHLDNIVKYLNKQDCLASLSEPQVLSDIFTSLCIEHSTDVPSVSSPKPGPSNVKLPIKLRARPKETLHDASFRPVVNNAKSIPSKRQGPNKKVMYFCNKPSGSVPFPPKQGNKFVRVDGHDPFNRKTKSKKASDKRKWYPRTNTPASSKGHGKKYVSQKPLPEIISFELWKIQQVDPNLKEDNSHCEDESEVEALDYGKFVKYVASEKWIAMHRAHPASLADRHENQQGGNRDLAEALNTSEPKFIDLVNDYHAYCLACRYHFYSHSDPCDISSFFSDHVNNSEHIGRSLLLSDDVDQIFVVADASEGLWQCTACDFKIPLGETKKHTRPLKTDIEEHLNSDQHAHMASLMQDPSLSILMSVATSHHLNGLIRKTAKREKRCVLCETSFSPCDQFKHIQSRLHLDKLKYFFKTQIGVNWKRLNQIEIQRRFLFLIRSFNVFEFFPVTEFALDEAVIEALASGRIESEETAKSVVNYCMEQILTKAWFSTYKVHPMSLKNRKDVEGKHKYETDMVDIVNDSHAYCKPCRFHVYSKFIGSDPCSFFVFHINSAEHLSLLEHFDENKQIFERIDQTYWRCKPCNLLIRKQPCPPKRLDTLIETHLRDENHKWNLSLVQDARRSVLMSLAMSPLMLGALEKIPTKGNLYCNFCSKTVPDFNETEHVKSQQHFQKVEEYLNVEMGVIVEDLLEEKNLRQVLEQLVKSTAEDAFK